MSVHFGTESIVSNLSWNTRISRTRLSTVEGLSLSAAPVLTAQGLDQLLRTIQQLGLKNYSFGELDHEAIVGEGESFRVERCLYNKDVVAVKHVKLDTTQANVQSSYHRLQSVLLEIQIMRHNPLKNHPNILQALGYGWKSHGERLLPYVVVEYAAHGSMRAWLRQSEQGVKVKFKLIGDIASGLRALHVCDIIHGDLKLDNILVVPAPERGVQVVAKLCDFGHSIILRKGTRDFKYFGTILYNAPEVEVQEMLKIEPEHLHKCDIWAYGLSVWEVFANGARYFQSSWAQDPRYNSQAFDPPSYVDALAGPSSSSPDINSATIHTNGSYVMVTPDDSRNIPFSDRAAESALGSFSHKHLPALSRNFVNTLGFPGLTIEKGYLRKLLQNTLQFDPGLRPSEITLVPTMKDWDRSDQSALQEQLALHTGSSALKFEIFRYDQDSEVPWEYKRLILQNLTALAEHQGTQDQATTAASTSLQASFCYIAGFGASPNALAARRFLDKAVELGQPMAKLFGGILSHALQDHTTELPFKPLQESYTDCIIRGFRADRLDIKGLELIDNDGNLLAGPEKFKNYTALTAFLQALSEPQREKTLNTYVITMPFSIRTDLLSLAIAMDDAITVRKLAKIFIRGKTTTPHDETALIQACRRGSADMVLALLDAGADPLNVTEDGCSLYHWLFMLGDGVTAVVNKLLALASTGKNELLDHVCSRRYVLHQQMPLNLTGTPLAFAIECNSASAVTALLKLGASPFASVYGRTEDLSAFQWTPIHLAFKYHQLNILKLLLNQSSPLVSMNNEFGINAAELARSICYSTPIERMMMHGLARHGALNLILSVISPGTLSTPTKDGQTAFAEAIDFTNSDVVFAMLSSSSDLYKKRFVDPDEPNVYTYPAIFASQIAANRDTSDALKIVKVLLNSNFPERQMRDSEGRTPLHFSVTGSSTSTTNWLLSNGYSVKDLDLKKQGPVHNCRTTASLDILLDLGASVNQTDILGHTPLHMAASQGFEDMVEGLIFRNANLTIEGSSGTALHCAVLAQSRRVMSLLLKADDGRGNKISIDAVDSNGDTALHLAARLLRPDLLHLLFAGRINRELSNNAGYTAKSQLGWTKSLVLGTEHFLNLDRQVEVAEVLHANSGSVDSEDTESEVESVDTVHESGSPKLPFTTGEIYVPVSAEVSVDTTLDPDITSKVVLHDSPAPSPAQNTRQKVFDMWKKNTKKGEKKAVTIVARAPTPQQFGGIPVSELLKSFEDAEKQYINEILKWSKWNADTLKWDKQSTQYLEDLRGPVRDTTVLKPFVSVNSDAPPLSNTQRWDASLRKLVQRDKKSEQADKR